MIDFLNSSFFLALVTFSVGGLAIFIYKKQKTDYKKGAASLILQELRYAEQLIRHARSNSYQYKLTEKLLPTNSWNDNIHLFLRDLEESEIDMISRFYAKVAFLDSLIQKISDFKTNPIQTQITITQPQSMNPIQNQTPSSVPIVLPIDPMQGVQQLLKMVTQEIEFVYNTPVGEKLKKLS